MRWEDSHFKPKEFGCHCEKCKNTFPLVYEQNVLLVVEQLEKIRRLLGLPIRVNRGYSCREHNAAIGGAKMSKHLTGEAADIEALGHTGESLRGTFEVAIKIRTIKNGGLGTYARAPKMLHYDTGPIRRWHEPLPGAKNDDT